MHTLSFWQKIGIVGLVVVICAALGGLFHYHEQVLAERQHQDQIYQQLDTIAAAKAHIKAQKTDAKKLSALNSLVKQAARYAKRDDASPKVKRQYQAAISAARQSFVKQDQVQLKTLTPDTKALAKLSDDKLQKQIDALKALAKTIKSHHTAVYSPKSYKSLLAKVQAATKSQQTLLKKHQAEAKKTAAKKAAAASEQAAEDSTDVTDQTDDTSSDTSATTSDADTGSTNYGTDTGSSSSGYTGTSSYAGSTWRPASQSNQSTYNYGGTSTGTTTGSTTGMTGESDSQTDSTATSDNSTANAGVTSEQPDAVTNLTNDPDQ